MTSGVITQPGRSCSCVLRQDTQRRVAMGARDVRAAYAGTKQQARGTGGAVDVVHGRRRGGFSSSRLSSRRELQSTEEASATLSAPPLP